MADAKTEKQKVKEITDKLEEGLKELFESEKYKNCLSTMSRRTNPGTGGKRASLQRFLQPHRKTDCGAGGHEREPDFKDDGA